MGTLLMTPLGEPVKDPTDDDMRKVLQDLEHEKSPDAEAMFSDDHGWTLSAYPNGTVILENIDMNISERRIYGLSHDEIIRMWSLLRSGDITALKKEKWGSQEI